jgi:hypothetical protein
VSDFDDWLTSNGKCRETASDLDEIQWLRMERQALRSSMLSAQERLAIDWAATVAKEQAQVLIHKTLRRLLELKN